MGLVLKIGSKVKIHYQGKKDNAKRWRYVQVTHIEPTRVGNMSVRGIMLEPEPRAGQIGQFLIDNVNANQVQPIE